MLIKVSAYRSLDDDTPLVFNLLNRPETELFQVRNIDGLGPVKSDVNTIPFGAIRGAAFAGSKVGLRNLVFTIGLNPDWVTWNMTKLRQELYKYFMTERFSRLVFETEEYSPVEISGYVETCEPVIFSKDQEMQVSIICPEPDFVTVAPIVINGQNTDAPISIDYNGTVKTGFDVNMQRVSGANPTRTKIQVGDESDHFFWVDGGTTVSDYFDMNSIPGSKRVARTAPGGELVLSLLDDIVDGSTWPEFEEGVQEFSVTTDAGIQNWTLTYFERFGGL